MTTTTPKMTGMTPNSLGGTFAFSPALLGQSPAAAHLLNKHRSPAALQAGFSTPDALAAMHMVGMGMTPSAIPQIMPPDESKKRELSEILRLLALRPGRISEEGVERLAKRMGLECYKDTAAGTTTMSLAAKIFLLDIDFRENKITRVALSFANTPGPSADLAHMADLILHRDLSPGGARPPLISPSLADFADNLDRLAKTDRLSSPPHLNCFTAITGVYRSLLKVFEHERSTLEGGDTAAMCKGSGLPRMHARGKVGLSVDYWRSRRFITPEPSSSPSSSSSDDTDIFRVLIEVEEVPTDFSNLNPITPVRTSDHWVSDEIKKPSDDNLFGDPDDTVTDWLEPPLEELMDIPGDPTQSRPPSSRFVARLDPPIAVPFQDELHLFNSLMLAPPVGIAADTLEALLFPDAPITPGGKTRKLFLPPGGGAEDVLDEGEDAVVHRYRLYSALKPVYARFVHEVPFSHPKELQGIFQILRQFAVVGTLLGSCFGVGEEVGEGVEVGEEEDVDAFMGDGEDEGEVVPVDVTMVAEGTGVFGLGVIFPMRGGVTSFSVEVGRNADVRVGEVESGKGKEVEVDRGGLERAVYVGEDLGIVVEWLRRR